MMTEPNSLPYASAVPVTSIDISHLRTLAICHYVWGGIAAAFSCFFIIYIVIGIVMARGGFPANPSQPPPPPAVGYIMASVGGCLVLAGWTLATLNIISGRSIARQKRRVFSIVIAGINCACVPFGTVLGVFTLIVLLRPSVKALYESSFSQA
jgi:hypothetical protein